MTTIPTLSALYASILADLEAEFTITIPIVGKSFLRAFAAIQAAKLKLLYLAIGSVQKNIFVDTADSISVGGTLERFGRVKIGRDPYPATFGEYSISVNVNVTGTIPEGTQWITDEFATNPNKLFILDADYVVAGAVPATYQFTVRALESGTGSKMVGGDSLTSTAPIAIADGVAAYDATVTEPTDAETTEEYRAKVLQAFRLEPQGGAASDYILWGSDAVGVKAIYPYAVSGAPNEVDVYVEATLADSTDGKGTPTSTILSDVEDAIELDPDVTLPLSERGRRPLGVFAVNVKPVVLVGVEVAFYSFENRTPEKDILLIATITDAIYSIRPFIAGADDPNTRNDILSRNYLISTVMAALPSAVFADLEMKFSGVPTTSRQFDNGEIPWLFALSYL